MAEPDPIDSNIGRLIRVRRLQINMSMSELGRRIGVTAAQMHKYEMAQDRVWAAGLYKIARILNVEVAYFYGGYKRFALSGDASVMEDYAAAAEAMFLAPELEALPRFTEPQIQAVRAMLRAMDPGLPSVA
jgi:transcriptional regulator with XRE-family HTH domain